MRYLVALLLFASPAYASDAIELVAGGVTNHYTAKGAHPEHTGKLNGSGSLIANPSLGIRYIHNNWSVLVLGGSNSVGLPIGGMAMGYGWNVLTFVYVGGILGGYIENNADYRAKGGYPVDLLERPNGTALVPIVGIDLQLKLPISRKWYIKQNNIFAPVITNHSLSLGTFF